MADSRSGSDGGLAPYGCPPPIVSSRSSPPSAISITSSTLFSQANSMSVVQCERASASTLPLAARMGTAGYRWPASMLSWTIRLLFPARQWFFQPSDKRFQFRDMLTNLLLADSLPESTYTRIQGTIQWYDSGSHGLLPPA